MDYVGWEALSRTQNVSIWWKIEIIINLSYLLKSKAILPSKYILLQQNKNGFLWNTWEIKEVTWT